jgi:hypothetical protein
LKFKTFVNYIFVKKWKCHLTNIKEN